MRIMLASSALLAFVLAVIGGPRLSGGEVSLLLEIGVGESEILACADRRGGIDPLDPAAFSSVESRRPSQEFLARMPRAVPELGALSDLARRSEVFQDDRLGIAFVHPAGWVVTRTAAGDGGTILRIAPRSSNEPRVFVSPCIFVFVLEDAPAVPEAVDPMIAQARNILSARLRDLGLRPVAGAPTPVTLFGKPMNTASLEAAIDGASVGVFEVVFDVDARKRAVGVGFTASASDRPRLTEAFASLARSLAPR